MMLLKKMYIMKIKNIENKIPDITNLANKTTFDTKIKKVKGELPSFTNLATSATALLLKIKYQC